MNTISLQESNLYRAIAELSYAIAKADQELDKKEEDVFMDIIDQELGKNDWVAEVRFEVIFNSLKPSTEEAYQHAMLLIEQNKSGLTREVVNKFKRILKGVAEVSGITEEEQDVIEKFDIDIEKLLLQAEKEKFQSK